jgi:hypothetical protein
MANVWTREAQCFKEFDKLKEVQELLQGTFCAAMGSEGF